VSAAITIDTEVFTKMDPYVQLTLSGQAMEKTKTHQSAGKTPVWNETKRFPVGSVQDLGKALKVQIMEEDIRYHDEVGVETLSLGLLYNWGQGIKEDFHVFSAKTGFSTGMLKLHTTWEAAPVKPVAVPEEKKAPTVTQPLQKVEDKKVPAKPVQ
jgi:Ca2+-dependent lipid-binding protein